MPAEGNAVWQGDLKTGAGTFTAGESISGQYSFRSRFEDGPGANPEQLIAAAHAACFSMALSAALADAGTPVESVKTNGRRDPSLRRGGAHDHGDRPHHRWSRPGDR
jgi:osmotically inducible protein OsmC